MHGDLQAPFHFAEGRRVGVEVNRDPRRALEGSVLSSSILNAFIYLFPPRLGSEVETLLMTGFPMESLGINLDSAVHVLCMFLCVCGCDGGSSGHQFIGSAIIGLLCEFLVPGNTPQLINCFSKCAFSFVYL